MVLNRLLFNPSDICGRYYGPDIRNFRFGSIPGLQRLLLGRCSIARVGRRTFTRQPLAGVPLSVSN